MDGWCSWYQCSYATNRRPSTALCQPSIYQSNYKRSLAIPFLVHVFSSLESQFPESARIASTLLGTVQSIRSSTKVIFDDVRSLLCWSKTVMVASPELFAMELRRWKNKYMTAHESSRLSSLAQSIKDCDQELFPNIFILLQIAWTIPVSSCECEWSASVLCQVNIYE